MAEQLSKRTAEADRRIGASVRAARLKAGLSQSRLAADLGITFQQLQKYEKGRNRVAVSTLLLIAEALAVPVSSFLDAFERQGHGAPVWSDLLTKENVRLLQAFDRIADAEVRARILNLVAAVTEGAASPALDGAAALAPGSAAR